MIDSRSDLYSLGCILYQLLTGRPAFQSSDTLELIHMHLAKAPPMILPRHMTPKTHPLLHALLTVLQNITTKMMNKQAEDRYQSTSGLIHDLNIVSMMIRTPANLVGTLDQATSRDIAVKLNTFIIGELDLYSIFRISQRLYGSFARTAAYCCLRNDDLFLTRFFVTCVCVLS